MSTAPGWYPDPSGLWEVRWFDGASWSDQVSTGGVQSSEPYPPSTQPPADLTSVLWSATATSEREPVQLNLTWRSLDVIPSRRPQETRRLPLWFVSALGTEGLGGDGSGNLRIQVKGAGYVGPSTFVIRGIPQVAWVRAIILRQRFIVAQIPVTTFW